MILATSCMEAATQNRPGSRLIFVNVFANVNKAARRRSAGGGACGQGGPLRTGSAHKDLVQLDEPEERGNKDGGEFRDAR